MFERAWAANNDAFVSDRTWPKTLAYSQSKEVDKLTVVITAIDTKVPSVTFKRADGTTRTIKVKDREKLQGVSVGDTVEITYIEAIAIKVEKAAKK